MFLSLIELNILNDVSLSNKFSNNVISPNKKILEYSIFLLFKISCSLRSTEYL